MMRAGTAALLLLLAGCAAGAQTPPAYVDVNALVPHHPLYGTLAQYDRQIAALSGTLHTRFANTDAQIDNASAAVRLDAASVSQRYTRVTLSLSKRPVTLSPSKRPVTLSSSKGAVTLSPSKSPVTLSPSKRPVTLSPSKRPVTLSPSKRTIEQQITDTYAQQRAQLQDTAQHDMAQYRAALNAQQQHAYAAFTDSVNERTRQAINLRAQELRERESNLLLELARQNAPRRLLLHARLQTLALDSGVRNQLKAEMRALQAQEDRELQRARAADAQTLQAYGAQMQARAQHDLALMQSDLASRSAANLAAREQVMNAQTSGGDTLNMPSAPAAFGSPAYMQAQYDTLRNTQLPDGAVFDSARNDLTTQWTALKAANDDATGHTRSQIDWLRHDREAVRKRIVAQIMDEAQRIAKTRGYSNVVNGRATAGALDLTPLVQDDLRSLSP